MEREGDYPVVSDRDAAVVPFPDAVTRDWLTRLRSDGAVRDGAVADLHALLLRAARFETSRRRAVHSHLRGDLDDIAQEAADDALLAVLARLDDFRGLSRFTTWASTFALYQLSVAQSLSPRARSPGARSTSRASSTGRGSDAPATL